MAESDVDTQVVSVAPQGLAETASRGAQVLAGGGLVVFPTETVYGVGARADLPNALARLRSMKGREGGKPFTVHVGSMEQAKSIAPIWLRCITAGQGDGSIRADVAPAAIALGLISLLVGALSDRHLGLYAAAGNVGQDRSELGRAATALIFEGLVPR